MAKAMQCDRCGGFYQEYGVKKNENNPNGVRFVSKNFEEQSYNYKLIDLCPRCMKELKAFLNIENEENRDSENKPLIQN